MPQSESDNENEISSVSPYVKMVENKSIEKRKNFFKRLLWVKFGAGILTVIFGVLVSASITSKIPTPDDNGLSICAYGPGIWSGLYFSMSALCGFICKNKKKKKYVVSFLLMDILSALLGGLLLGFEIHCTIASNPENYLKSTTIKSTKLNVFHCVLAILGFINLALASASLVYQYLNQWKKPRNSSNQQGISIDLRNTSSPAQPVHRGSRQMIPLRIIQRSTDSAQTS